MPLSQKQIGYIGHKLQKCIELYTTCLIERGHSAQCHLSTVCLLECCLIHWSYSSILCHSAQPVYTSDLFSKHFHLFASIFQQSRKLFSHWSLSNSLFFPSFLQEDSSTSSLFWVKKKRIFLQIQPYILPFISKICPLNVNP